jgi:hypothetical protein
MTKIKTVSPITVAPDLWTTSLLPEGVLERWIFADGSLVEAGDPVAAVRIESSLHEIMAPVKGRLHVACRTNAIIEPGSIIGDILRIL